VASAAVVARSAFTYAALARLARGRERRAPLTAPEWAGRSVGVDEAGADAAAVHATAPTITVVIPARDEAERIAGVLTPLAGAPRVLEVVVVDDRSTDATASIARGLGARVIDGAELPTGWIGKPWALQQGLVAARGDVVVFLDADVQPDPRLPAAVAAALVDGVDLASAQLAFACPDAAQRVLHPALLATLIYRLGPLDTKQRVPASAAAINGQCFAARRDPLVRAGGFGLIAGVSTDDVALARALAAAGWRIAVADGSHLGSVRMYESAGEALREWAGRSLALPGASSRSRQWFDLGVVWTVQGCPALRVWRAVARAAMHRSLRAALPALRPTDIALLAIRWSLQIALRRVYRRGARADLLALAAPLADPVAVVALTRGTIAPVRSWRGRAI
jgi:dolichol-phosphate mannosyltransferase